MIFGRNLEASDNADVAVETNDREAATLRGRRDTLREVLCCGFRLRCCFGGILKLVWLLIGGFNETQRVHWHNNK